jgi:hypothetical protein
MEQTTNEVKPVTVKVESVEPLVIDISDTESDNEEE